MITLDSQLEPLDLVHVQEEPALEIALPQVFDQPVLTVLRRGKLAGPPEAAARRIAAAHQAAPDSGLGGDYQELVTEFAPLFAWATACWDFLLTTEGVKFLPRRGEQKWYARGDYRAFSDRDYSRLTHGVFRACVLEFAALPDGLSLAGWLREQFWPRVLAGYRRLDQPADSRQRALTPYSYLRCVPYQFLSEFHHDLVYRTVQRLPEMLGQAVEAYFLSFFTLDASAQALGCAPQECQERLRQALTHLLVQERLVYCLLRQIERY